jgi:CBS domain-containing protein/gamma-glutamylcysteine synthetase
MGEQKVSLMQGGEEMANFVKSLLNDVQALKYMLDNNWFETEDMRIGAEQEMVMVDNHHYKPAKICMQVLREMGYPDWLETELASFNLETNLLPRVFSGKSFSEMEAEISYNLSRLQEQLDRMDASYVLTGVLPTIRKFDLKMKHLTPKKRYRALMKALSSQLIGKAFELKILGIDELIVQHDSPLMEACNTSFQVHLQVRPEDFVHMYNISQALAAPVMAVAANSPLVFGKRLWHETRIALFQQALDTRSSHDDMRERSPRVSFGTDWLNGSILDIYKEDISRYRVLISADVKEDSMALIRDKKVPRLQALQVHNSTVYRWNRPCYGISGSGKPHLRIENRVLPAGPTVLDEMANAAFWLGAMTGMGEEIQDIRDKMAFVDVRDNFGKAAKFGIDTTFTWFNDRKVTAADLILDQLLPLARKGLQLRHIDEKDIDRYLGVIEQRARKHMTGARWQLRAFTKLTEQTNSDEALTVITSAMIKNQRMNIPVHDWELPDLADLDMYKPSKMVVSEFMQTDLFTVQKDDIVEFVVEIMDWRNLKFLLVEDEKGKYIGLITVRSILKFLAHHMKSKNFKQLTVKDLMIRRTSTIAPHKSITEAIALMQKENYSVLPVVKDGELRGVITEKEFLQITARLIDRLDQHKKG